MTPEELKELEERAQGFGADGVQASIELERYNQAQAQPSEADEAQKRAVEKSLSDQRPATALQTENPVGNILVDGTKIAANAFVDWARTSLI